jgi:hypothetical protein
VRTFLFRATLLAAAAGVLAGCSLFRPPEKRECPRVSLLADAGQVTLYRPGPGRDLTDVVFEAKMEELKGACSYNGQRLRVQAKINIVAARGPAATGGKVNFPFFVAVTDSEQNVLAKQVFDSVIEIPDGRRRAGVFEEMEQIVLLNEGETGSDYEVIVGFQLSQEQLDRNRRRRR